MNVLQIITLNWLAVIDPFDRSFLYFQNLLAKNVTNCNAKPNTRLFIGMEAKNSHLRIRLTERQVKRLAEVLLEKQKNKSVIVRDALDNYLDETDKSHDTQTPRHIRNKKILK